MHLKIQKVRNINTVNTLLRKPIKTEALASYETYFECKKKINILQEVKEFK